jgi:hypothetical protein
MHPIAYVKEHPILSGSLVVGVVVLIYLLRKAPAQSQGGSGMLYSGPSESLQAMGLQASAQVQGMQISANAKQAELNAQVNIAQLLSSADVEKYRIVGNVELQKILGTVDLTKYQTDAYTKIALAQIGAATPLPPANPPQQTTIWGRTQQWAHDVAAAQETTRTDGQMIVFGVNQTQCDMSTVGGQNACAQRNIQNTQAAYDAHPGSVSYLADNIYSGTPEAYAKYGGYSGTDPAKLAGQREFEKANYGYSWS